MKYALAKLRTFVTLALISAVFVTSSATALPAEQKNLFDSGILYYDLGATCSIGGSTMATDGVMSTFYPGFVDEASVAVGIENFIRATRPDSPWLSIPNLGMRLIEEGKERNINPLLIVVIGRQESQLGTSSVARSDRNPPNYNSFGDKGAPDRNNDDYKEYPSFEGSLFGEGSFTARVQNRLSGQHPNYVNVKNMYEYISVHLSGRILYADADGRSYDSTMGEYVDVTDVVSYHNNAQKWIGEITGQDIQLDPTGAVSGCSSTGVVNGSIAQTALSLAWTDSAKVEEIRQAVRATNGLCTMETNPSGCGLTKANAGAFIRERDAKPEYVSAVKQFNPGNDSDGSNWAFSDCGVFAATVLRGSGVDSDFPARGTGPNQLPYLLSSSGYDTVLFTDTSQLQPGDILIKDGHVAVYVGPNQTTNAVVVQASWGQHVPSANQRSVTPGDGYYRARKVGL